MNLLLIEDEVSVSDFIKKGFLSEGHLLDVANDGTIGKRLFWMKWYDLVILDVNLRGVNGFDLCIDFKKYRPETPIIFLSAFDELGCKVTAFKNGADDYLVKPVEFQEILLRAITIMRRARLKIHSDEPLSIADLEMEPIGRRVTRAGKWIELTAREFSLLQYLLINKGRVVSRLDIAEKVWDINFDGSTNVIDVYINYLRKKIDKGHELKLLRTIIGMGYTLRDN